LRAYPARDNDRHEVDRMLQFDLNEPDGIVTLAPEGPLTAGDFDALGAVVDPYIERTGGLRGLVISADPFPGWNGSDLPA
jgi:hypothetical protein